MEISKFLEMFSPISLQYRRKPGSSVEPWVFWSENEGSENNSDLATLKIHDKIISVFSNIKDFIWAPLFGQLWVPVTISGRQLLSTSGQLFAVWNDLSNEIAKYRIYSDKYKYNIDMVDNEGDDMIISGGPANAFLNRLLYIYRRVESEDFGGEILKDSIMLPICLPSQSLCIGVLEFTTCHTVYDVGIFVLDLIKAVKEAGLDVIHAQDLIPYATINGLKHAKDEIKEALKVVCESHNLPLAQVWTACEDKSHVPSSSLEDTQTNRILAIKLTGYLNQDSKDEFGNFELYFRACDVVPCTIWSGAPAEVGLPLQTLQDYGSHYIHALRSSRLIDWEVCKTSALGICLRSNDTGDFNYALEFIWTKKLNYVNLLEAIILTLKRCLPRFKFASGVELGDELDVIVARSATQSENDKIGESETFKIFQGKTSSPMPKAPEGKNYISPSKVACKTTPKVLPREVIEKQFGKTMKEAAKNLNVSLSTFKRKFKGFGIPEWPGPNFLKRKANDSGAIQIDTDEEDNGVIQEPSTIIIDQNTLTIKAELSDNMIKFDVPISQATFVTIEKEIGMKWELSVGTYKLKYLDEEGDWILLRSDAEMRDCIKSLRKSNRTAVKIRVLPSPQPISSPSGSLTIAPDGSPTNQHGSPGSKPIDPLGPNNNQGPTNQTSGSRETSTGSPNSQRSCQVNSFCKTKSLLNHNFIVSHNQKCVGTTEEIEKPMMLTADAGSSLEVQPFTARSEMKSITIKASYKEHIIRFRVAANTGIVTVKEEVAKRFKLDVGASYVKYLDDDDEWVLIACDADLQECVELSTCNIIRLSVHDLSTIFGSSCESSDS